MTEPIARFGMLPRNHPDVERWIGPQKMSNPEPTAELSRLRQLMREIAACRQDSIVVHELVQQALGYDPDIEDHEDAGSDLDETTAAERISDQERKVAYLRPIEHATNALISATNGIKIQMIERPGEPDKFRINGGPELSFDEAVDAVQKLLSNTETP